jgi:hypothetical protein
LPARVDDSCDGDRFVRLHWGRLLVAQCPDERQIKPALVASFPLSAATTCSPPSACSLSKPPVRRCWYNPVEQLTFLLVELQFDKTAASAMDAETCGPARRQNAGMQGDAMPGIMKNRMSPVIDDRGITNRCEINVDAVR